MGYYSSMLTDTAVLKTVNGSDANGRPNIIALDEIDCKIEFKNSISIKNNSEENTPSGRLFTEAVVKTADILEIKNKEFKVIKVNPYYPLDSCLLAINEVYFA